MASPSTRWDLGRFVNTLAYFGAVPLLSGVDWFQQWLGSRPNPAVDSRSMQAILQEAISNMNPEGKIQTVGVIGATGELGVQVIQQLRQQGRSVQLMPEEQSSLPIGLETVPLDQRDQPVDGLVCCTDAIDLLHATGLSDWLQQTQNFGANRLSLFDFSQTDLDLQEIWGAVDDVVMGGVSQSRLEISADQTNQNQRVACFTGRVSTANSGGFASVRTRNLSPAIDLSAFDGIELRVKGDGQRYKFMLRTETRWDGVAYCQSFDTVADRWITVQIPFDALIPVFRARTIESGQFDRRVVCAMQLMLSKFEYDGALNPSFQPGIFQLQVDAIQAYRHSRYPKLVVLDPIDRSASPQAAQLSHWLSNTQVPYLRIQAHLADRATVVADSVTSSQPSSSPAPFTLPHFKLADQPFPGSIPPAELAALGIAALSQPLVNRTLYAAIEPSGIPLGEWDRLFRQLV
ncbi:MAG: CIA30 family protein [Elainella sp. Prado103]|nr:CIA30 family protein [Elainella sp. Prado103]